MAQSLVRHHTTPFLHFEILTVFFHKSRQKDYKIDKKGSLEYDKNILTTTRSEIVLRLISMKGQPFVFLAMNLFENLMIWTAFWDI